VSIGKTAPFDRRTGLGAGAGSIAVVGGTETGAAAEEGARGATVAGTGGALTILAAVAGAGTGGGTAPGALLAASPRYIPAAIWACVWA